MGILYGGRYTNNKIDEDNSQSVNKYNSISTKFRQKLKFKWKNFNRNNSLYEKGLSH